MRPRGSLAGPLLLIVIGALFLMRAVSPNFHVWDIFRLYWPYLLIAWGVLSLIEVGIRFTSGAPLSRNFITGGGWFLVVILCIFGLSSFEFGRHDMWWHGLNLQHDFAAFGEEHEYSVTPQQVQAGASPHVVIERFRGDAKITVATDNQVSVSGHKSIRAFDVGDATNANKQSAVQIVQQGSTIVIRCNQDKADSRDQITTYLDITVPKGASVEATGTRGDFDIAGISGNVDLSSENAGVRLEDLAGNVTVETRRSDLIRCMNVQGTVDLRGHGEDVELTKIAGQVTINGSFTGTVTLHDLAKTVRIENMRTQLEIAQIPGEVRLERGNLSLENIVGPMKLSTHDTDVSLNGATNEVSMEVDKGDIEIRPEHLPLPRMTIRTRSGNIELALPQSAGFALNANTDHGEIDNQFGDGLTGQTQGRGARLQGTTGSGPDVVLNTGRGSITVRKASVESVSTGKVARGPVRLGFPGV